jgi:hypothetical protein
MTPTGKIIAVVLEEVNGYTKEEAEKYSKDCEGSLTWVRIHANIRTAIAKARKEERKK